MTADELELLSGITGDVELEPVPEPEPVVPTLEPPEPCVGLDDEFWLLVGAGPILNG